MTRWIGVDLDSTLARWDGYQGLEHIGEPIPAMVERVQAWIAEGREVRIMTARVAYSVYRPTASHIFHTKIAIERWCKEHVGKVLPVTCIKDADMEALYDDRVVQMEPGTGRLLEDVLSARIAELEVRSKVDANSAAVTSAFMDLRAYGTGTLRHLRDGTVEHVPLAATAVVTSQDADKLLEEFLQSHTTGHGELFALRRFTAWLSNRP